VGNVALGGEVALPGKGRLRVGENVKILEKGNSSVVL